MRAASASASAAFAVSGFGASARPYPRTARHSSAMVDEIRGRSSPTSSPADAFWIATKADERPPRAPIKRPAHRAGKRTFVDWPDSTSSLSHCVKTWSEEAVTVAAAAAAAAAARRARGAGGGAGARRSGRGYGGAAAQADARPHSGRKISVRRLSSWPLTRL